MKGLTDIIISTCNRKHFLKRTIDALYDRLENPKLMELIVIDDNSTDGTLEYLQEMRKRGLVHKVVSRKFSNLCEMYNEGFRYVMTDYFIVMNDDLIIPKLKPDVVEQLIALMEKYPDHGGISCRIQHIPNMKWLDGDLTPARRGMSACFRIHRRSDIKEAGGFGKRYRDEMAFMAQMRKIGKKASWANNLWCNHIGQCINRGYKVKPNEWSKGIHTRKLDEAAIRRKPYPKIDPLTNRPLKGQKIYR